MRSILLTVGTALVVTLAGCWGGGEPEVPSQNYLSALMALGRDTGGMTGRILFPSEYNQRSTIFSLDGVQFVTHPDGRFWIRRVPAGEHTLHVFIEGYEPVDLAVNVREGDLTRVEPLRLSAARGRVVGRLVNENGKSAAGLEVRLRPNGGMTLSDDDGIFQFIGVPHGEHTLILNDPVYFAGNRHFDLQPDERRNLGLIKVFRQSTPSNQAVGLRER